MRADLYDAVYGTGPTLGQLQSDPKDFRTSLLSTRSVAQDASALDALDKAAGRQGVAIADTERINKPIVGSERTYDPNRLPGAGAMFTVGRDVDIVGSAPKRPSVAPDERDLPADIDMGSGPTEDTDIEDLAPPERTLLERLGRAIRNNPELAAMGAQLAGGLISNAAQNRAQRRADRTNQQRTARSNLISALTGGRVRPDVERAQADTGGILSLNTLGQAIRGGGAMVQGELARRVEEDERERKADLEEREMQAKEFGTASLAAYRAQKSAEGAGPPPLSAAAQKQMIEISGSIDVVDQYIKDFDEIADKDNKIERAIAGLLTNVPILGSSFYPNAQTFTDQRALLVGQVAKIINGGSSGQISNFEQKLAEQVIPDIRNPRDTGEFGRRKLERLRDLLALRRAAIAEGYGGSLQDDFSLLLNQDEEQVGSQAESPSVTSENITDEQKALLFRARSGDEEAMDQARALGLI